MSVCVCMWFSKPSRLPVYIYAIVCILIQLIHVHLHMYMYITYSILLLSPFLRLSLLSLFPFLSLMLVCYTHISMYMYNTCLSVYQVKMFALALPCVCMGDLSSASCSWLDSSVGKSSA